MHRTFLRRPLVLTLAASLASTVAISPAGANPSADEKARLALQHKLDYDVPLSEATFIGTHNSFNNSDDGYSIPNQNRDMIDQLDAGFRVLSYDLYGLSSTNHTVVLCHGDICSPFDTTPAEALDDLDDWLTSNPEEVVMIMLEYDLTSSERDSVASAIASKVGDKVFVPQAGSSESCTDLPLNDLTKRQVLLAGKQLIITTTVDDSSCPDDGAWRDYVWNVRISAQTGDYTQTDIFRDRWGVAVEDRSDWGYNTHFWSCAPLFLESCLDNVKDSYELSSSEITTALKKGAGIIGLDFGITSDRHGGALWSWDDNQPASSVGNEDCAYQGSDDHWTAASCSLSKRFACQSVLDGSWAISTSSGSWATGSSKCASLGSEYVFAGPVNARMNDELGDARAAAGLSTVWVKATDVEDEGDWVVPTVVDRTELDGHKLVAGWSSGICLNVVGDKSSSNGATVNTYDCNAVSETWWYDSADGKIKAYYDTSMCLNVVGNQSTANGATVNLYQCSAVTETWQYWESDGKIHAAWDTSMCLNVVGNQSTANGQTVNLYNCGSVTETWSFMQYDE